MPVRARLARVFLFGALALGGCAADRLASAPAAHGDAVGELSFQSAGRIEREGARFRVQETPETISGDLRLPDGVGAFPAVVLAHGCNGNRNVERAWGTLLRGWGYATLVIDSFTARGLSEVCTQAGRLMPLQRVPDAYGALRLLASHPRIDARRIALMGFSHGGALTMLASTTWAKDRFVPAGAHGYRAFIAFYPNCNGAFPERSQVSAPVRIHSGAADDWTPAGSCAELAAALKAGGQDVGIEVYPGAHHAFDQAPPREIRLPNVNNGADCFPRLASILGPGAAPGLAGCVKKGATIAGNPAAAEQARRNVRTQLDALLK